MRKSLIALTLAAGLSAISLPAFAEQNQPTEKKQPVRMTDQQMDDVTAGALVNVVTNLRNTRRTTVNLDLDLDINIDNSSHSGCCKGKGDEKHSKSHGKRSPFPIRARQPV